MDKQTAKRAVLLWIAGHVAACEAVNSFEEDAPNLSDADRKRISSAAAELAQQLMAQARWDGPAPVSAAESLMVAYRLAGSEG